MSLRDVAGEVPLLLRSCEAKADIRSAVRVPTAHFSAAISSRRAFSQSTPHGTLGDVERFGDLGLDQSGEIPHLDDTHEALVAQRDLLQRFIDADQLGFGGRHRLREIGIERDFRGAPPRRSAWHLRA